MTELTTQELLGNGYYHYSVRDLYGADQVEAALKRFDLDPVLHRLSFGFKRRGELLMMGDLPLQIVINSGKLEGMEEGFLDERGEVVRNNLQTPVAAFCVIRRKGLKGKTTSIFTKAMAEKTRHARGSFYDKHPEQFLKFSARSLALKERFCDVLCGIALNMGELRDNEAELKAVGETDARVEMFKGEVASEQLH